MARGGAMTPGGPGLPASGDELRMLRAFCYAARFQNFSRAAEHIDSSQPAVSRQVRTLEERFGTILFDRKGPRLTLTSSGEQLFRLAMPLVQGLDRLPDAFVERLRGVPVHHLEVAAGPTSAASLLPSLLGQFRARHPEVRVSVRIGSGSRRLEWLRNYEVDIAFGAMDSRQSEFRFRPILTSRSMLITPLDHPLAGSGSIDLKEAAAYPTVTHTRGRYINDVAQYLLRQHGVVPNSVVEVDEWSIIKAYVEAGVGLSVVPELCLGPSDRVWRKPVPIFPPRRYGLLSRGDALLSLAAVWFIDVVRSAGAAGDP